MPAPQSKAALQRLATRVTQRRVELGMHKSDVATAAKITVKTYDKIEQAEPVRDVTYGKVEPILGWATGSCRDILSGRAPTIVEKTSAGGVISPVASGDLEADIEQAVQDAGSGQHSGSPEDEPERRGRSVHDHVPHG